MSPRRRGGFVLLPVALALAIVAALAYLMSHEAGVEVDTVAAEREANEVRLVAEAGLAHAIWTANNSACTGYALPSTSFGAHAYSATFTPTSGSPISVTATGTLASGATRSRSRADMTVYDAPVNTTLQPNASAGEDAWLYMWAPGWNYGLDNEVWVDNTFSDSIAHALLEFDLSAVPASARVQSAMLQLHQNTPSSSGGAVGVRRVTSAWAEGGQSGGTGTASWLERAAGVAWGTPGGDFDAASFASTVVPSGTVGWSQWDVTSLVDGWLDGTYPNLGLILVPETPGTKTRFDSSDHSDPTLRPKLVLVYACECGSGTPTTYTLSPGPAAADAYAWDGAHQDKNFGVSTILKVNNASAEQFSVLRFDLSSIPPEAVVTSAALDLYLEGGNALSNGVLDIHRAAQPWIEGTQDDQTTTAGVTYNEYALGNAWTSAGGDYDATPIDTVVIPSLSLATYQWDVTAVVADWVTGAATNDGLFLRASGGTVDKISFTSGDGASATDWPRLTVSYTCPCGAVCPADPPAASTVILSTMSAATLGGLAFTDKDLAEYDKDTASATLYLDGSAVGITQDIDAAHVLANGHIVLSTIGTATLGGVAFENEDLVDYDPVADTATLIFDGSALFTVGSTDVSAVHVKDNGHIILSNGYAATLGGLAFEPNDLVLYDPVTDTAIVLLDGDAVGLSGWIDAVHLMDDGNLVLSTDAPATLGGLGFTEGDLVEYDPLADTATLFLDGALFSAAENVRSAHVGAGSGVVGSCSVQTLSVQIAQNADDAEEQASDGVMLVTDMDLELGEDGIPLYVGMRFTGIAIEQGAQIVDAYVDFTAEQTIGLATSVTLRGEAADDALAFSTTGYDISSRSLTTASVDWPNIPGWTLDNVHTSPDIGPIVQEIVTRAGWASGNALVLRVDGTGERVAKSHDMDPSKSPVLRISYCGDPLPVPGPIAHWKLDDGSGVLATDSEGGHDGTVTGAAWTTGHLGGALDFNGASDQVLVADDPALSLTSEFTLMGWINADTLSAHQLVFNKGLTGNNQNYWLGTVGDEITFGFYTGGYREFNTTAENLSTGQWYHIAATFDDAADDVRVYLDGTEVLADTTTYSPTANGEALQIGKSQQGEHWNGRLDDLRIYDRVLGASEIADIAAPGGGCIFRDQFDQRAYNNSDGNATWAGDWFEEGETTSATGGDIQILNDVSNYQLRVQDDNNKITRELDLSGGHSVATLRLEYRRDGLEGGEYVAVEVYDGASWRELARARALRRPRDRWLVHLDDLRHHRRHGR